MTETERLFILKTLEEIKQLSNEIKVLSDKIDQRVDEINVFLDKQMEVKPND